MMKQKPMTVNPVPNDWFAGVNFRLICTGGPGIYQGADLVRSLLTFRSLSFQIALSQETINFLTPGLLETLGSEFVITLDVHQPDLLDELSSFLQHTQACIVVDLDTHTEWKSRREQLVDAVNAATDTDITVLTVTDKPGTLESDTFLFAGDWAPVVEWIAIRLSPDLSWVGKRVLITAGPTEESIDPVRYITNRSSGKMGFALARQAVLRGAEATLITGPVNLRTPVGVNRVDVVTAQEMYKEAVQYFLKTDVLIAAAAVEDLKPLIVSAQKMKKQELTAIECEAAVDVLASLGKEKSGQILVGFSVETENTIENSRAKLAKKSLDMIVINDPGEPGAAFRSDTNKVTVLRKNGAQTKLPLMSKDELAAQLLQLIREQLNDG